MTLTLVSSEDEIIRNLIHFSRYQFGDDETKNEYKKILKRGKIFIYAIYEGKYIFCPSRFVGYKDCTISSHITAENKNGSITTAQINKILKQKPKEDKIAEQKYLQLCNSLDNLKPWNNKRKYWKINIPQNIDPSYTGFPGEEN